MRGKESLTEDDFGGGTIPLELDSESKLGGPMNTAVAINMRDYLDCIKADALLVHFLDTPQFSGGTIGEMAWAFSKQIPVIVRCPKVCYYTTHPMISTWITCRVDTVDEGIDCVVSFLLP
jgi:nucleoside 2-deoxyribosyltransferase